MGLRAMHGNYRSVNRSRWWAVPDVSGGRWIVCLFAVPAVGAGAAGQVTEKPVLGQAEVTGNDVYVRSGASLNHYPVAKLQAGDRVTIVGEMGDWYEIHPPEEVFSFISGDYVDTADNKSGVVNGSNVRVRAGSALPEFSKLRYVVQTKLPKGAEVTILRREPDGFLRIKPPAGTSVWINRAYVEYVPVAMVGAEDRAPATLGSDADEPQAALSESADAGPEQAQAGPEQSSGRKVDSTDESHRSMFSAALPAEQRRKLEEIDAATRAELAKPVYERLFGPLIERYNAVAEPEGNELARQYAQARVEQLSRMKVLIETVGKMRELDEEAEAKRRGFLEDRARIRETLPPIPSELDAQGELRISALYPPGSLPRRYRLVDPSGTRERTIGYVEIPQDSTIAVDGFLGRYVGVRASARRLQTGGVDPVPIYVAGELILLQPTPTIKSQSE